MQGQNSRVIIPYSLDYVLLLNILSEHIPIVLFTCFSYVFAILQFGLVKTRSVRRPCLEELYYNEYCLS
jgi:hypothetical protein